MILSSLAAALAPANLLYLLAGSVLGILIGAAPGLGPVFGLAILLSMTFSMPVEGALIFLSAVYAASVYGGSITAILLNTPGTPGSVATCFDGFALSKRGEAGRALGISTMASFIGGVVGVLALALWAPCWRRLPCSSAPVSSLCWPWPAWLWSHWLPRATLSRALS